MHFVSLLSVAFPRRTRPTAHSPARDPSGPSARAQSGTGRSLGSPCLARGLALGLVLATMTAAGAMAQAEPMASPFLGVHDPAPSALAQLDANSGSTGGAVATVEHRVPLGDGRELAVKETFSASSFARRPRRAMLFLSGSAFDGDHWRIPVEGYDGPAMAGRRGFFAYTVDYLGVGESFAPIDGTEATFEANRQALEVLLRYIRWRRQVPRVDLVGAGYGGSLAAVLAEDRARVRSVVMSAMLYDQLEGGPLLDPAFVEMLESSPDGYAFFPGEGSLIFMGGAPQAVRDFVVATQGGFYPTENFLVASRGLPFFDPSRARAPGLILFGRNDIVVGPDGVDQLALDYGRNGALLIVNEAAGHAPRTESPEIADWFWRNIWAFVDSDPGISIGGQAERSGHAKGNPWIDGGGDQPESGGAP